LLFHNFLFDVVNHGFLPEQQRHDEENRDDGGYHAPYDDTSERLLSLGSDAIGERGRQEAEAGCHAGHDNGAHLIDAAMFETGAVDALALGAADS
jgi:hypothetical protein